MKKWICSLILLLCCFNVFSNAILKGSVSGLAPFFQNDYNNFDEQNSSVFNCDFCPITGLELSALWEFKSKEATSFKMICGLNFGYEVTAFYLDGVVGFNKILSDMKKCNLELSVAGLVGPAMGLFYGIMYLDFGIEGNLYFVPKSRKGFFGGIGLSDKDLFKLSLYENNSYSILNFNMIRINLTCGIML